MKPFWMLSILVIVIIVISGAGCILPSPQKAVTNQTIDGVTIPTTTGSPTPAEARQIAAAAYVYGYPLVILDVTKDQQTATPAAAPGVAPINQITRAPRTPAAQYRGNTRANVDTLYTSGWFNLTKEPMVLTVPEANGRFYVATLFDAWQNVFAAPGPRTTGNESGNFAIVGPGWNGTLPSNVTKLQSPTNTVLLAARILQNGPADIPAAVAFESGFKLTPLSAWSTNYTPPTNVAVNPNVNVTASPVRQVANMTPATFFGRIATVMEGNPPRSADKPVIDQIARIGIVPGTTFDWNGLNATTQNAIRQGFQDGIAQVQAASLNFPGAVEKNGWITSYSAGVYGTNYTLNAGEALSNILPNQPQDTLYPFSNTNATGAPYSGAYDYVLHFPANATPPVNAFWSLTMYGTDNYLVPNSINRYAISPHLSNLTHNLDGSLDIYIQHASPGPAKESNWLPAPSGQFYLEMRLYWPQESALNGSWVPPAVQTVGPATTTANATPTSSPSPPVVRTAEPAPLGTPTPSVYPTPTPSVSPTPTPSVSPTPTPSVSPTPTVSPTPSWHPTTSPKPQGGGAASLMVLFFYKPECPYCQAMEPKVTQLQNTYAGKVSVQWIVSDQSPLTDQYGVTTVPTLILLNNGNEAGRWVSASDTSGISAQIGSLLGAS